MCCIHYILFSFVCGDFIKRKMGDPLYHWPVTVKTWTSNNLEYLLNMLNLSRFLIIWFVEFLGFSVSTAWFQLWHWNSMFWTVRMHHLITKCGNSSFCQWEFYNWVRKLKFNYLQHTGVDVQRACTMPAAKSQANILWPEKFFHCTPKSPNPMAPRGLPISLQA